MQPTPDYRLSEEDLEGGVYPPAEDTFLMMDALEADSEITLEVGSGSGVVTVFLRRLLLPSPDQQQPLLSICTDLNRRALICTRRTAALNSIGKSDGEDVDVLECNLADPLCSTRMKGCVDVLLFNPPYVPTSEPPKGVGDLYFAGGPDGCLQINALLPHVADLLSPNGVFYLIVMHQGGAVERTLERAHSLRLEGTVALDRRCGIERLCVLRLTKREEEEEG